tara:strand:+ start:294 stop:1910 length:1617 start_codon:yes stop_codon:yes gene_type:complete
MIIVVSDAFGDQFTGGAELTTDALLDAGFNNYKKLNSQILNIETIKKYKDEKWIFFNFHHVSDKNLLSVVKNIKDYQVVEYDYKYCKFRLKSKHEYLEGWCECYEEKRGKLVAIFLAKSKNLFFMSQLQKDEYESVFPILKNHKNSHVLNSVFTKKNIEYILSLDTSKKNNKYLILNSNSWVKGTERCIEYAQKNKIKYDLVSGVPHHELLSLMARYKGLIFLPNGYDTCPRIVMEARLLNCDLILNDNVQHRHEPWFKNRESIIQHVKKQKHFFYEKCLKEEIKYNDTKDKIKFHFIIPGYNSSEWLPQCVRSIKRQDYENYTVTYIDDLSTDNSVQLYKNLTDKDKRFKILINDEKKYALKNISQAIESLNAKNNHVIIVLDADDWLSGPNVLSYLNCFYQENDCWMTYGSYMYYPIGERGMEPSEYPENIIANNEYRNDTWRASHLRTFKKKLWDKIEKKDLVDADGEYYKMSYDQAMMLPMLEMSGEKAKYISEILHVYNRANSLNVDKLKRKEQYDTMLRIRAKNKYKRLVKI